ncbi:SAM-dependent methyltransferase [Dethiosulfatarculus sandiegensis]|uniref:SAM-dependent methyltransferase n=1 Tax=Dethiosulfatarculus sandiegensis TaxID=1429043 RepID=A0A0D2GCP0_9BACT|nr:cyclopropane-fatty-acyl-phospholipid synthase family protein [Dethiosulfatarculus sandiegensis]KIX12707.1 SAM-dependent methyltransferase [Dethiosulfatarculus sandiegensis]
MKSTLRNLSDMLHQADPATPFCFELWNGEVISKGASPCFTLKFKNKTAAQRLLRNRFLGFGECYMQGDLELDGNFDDLFRLGIALEMHKDKLSLWQKFDLFLRYLKTLPTLGQAGQNIRRHYDLGNDFYSLYLDPSLTYSCAYFKKTDQDLISAQEDKYDHITKKLMLKPGDTLLDIGCGWGGMLIFAASNYRIKGLGVTLSPNQEAFARRRIEELGLAGKIQVRLQDYRQVEGQFDKIVSIGMYEHVGKRFQKKFMQKVSSLLKPGGLGLLHTIGKDTPSPTDPWTLRYIFPGGYLPSLSEITGAMGEKGLSIWDVENLRLHYAHTLDLWADKFETNWEKAIEMTDRSFARRWRLFLRSSAAGFRYGQTRLFQLLFCKGLNNKLPLTREHIYALREPVRP